MVEQSREGERLPGEQTGQYPNINEQGMTHEQMVTSFRSLIREQQAIHADLYAISGDPHERETLSPETAVRGVLDWYAGSANQELGEHLFTVRNAWDALNYDKYEPGTRAEGLAGSILQAYASATREPTIKLTHPMEVRLLDALTEAAGVQHQRGQTEVEIPEKLRNYKRYLMSPEYQAKLTEAQAKRRK